MKKFFEKPVDRFFACLAFVAAGVMSCPVVAAAQDDLSRTVLSNVGSKVKDLGVIVISLVQYISLIAAIILLGIQGVKFARKDPQASGSIVLIGVFLLILFAGCAIGKQLLQSGSIG